MSLVREINDPAALAPLVPRWNELLAQTPGASFFHSAEWLICYWRHFGNGQRLRLLVISNDDGQIVGILPLVVRSSRRQFAGIRVLTYPLDDWGSFFGPIGPDAAHILARGLEHIRRTPRDWQIIELPWVDALGRDAGCTEQALGSAGLEAACEAWHTSALIHLDRFDGWEDYWASRESRWRNNVRRSEKKLACRGKITYLRYRPSPDPQADPRWDLYDICESIAEASWQADSTTGTTLTHPGVRAFLRECHAVAARAGALDINILFVDGRPVAFNYAYCHAGNVFGLRTGFDATAASEGAGTVLQARMIADSFARGDHLYDLGPGYLDCKRYWLTDARASYRYTHFPAHVPVARLMQAKRGIERWWRGGRQPATGK
jgi:CelD/BcsL family acetyltransferase involved in cellulose biosynthesis